MDEKTFEALKEVVRISDRNHEAWDTVKQYIEKRQSTSLKSMVSNTDPVHFVDSWED